MSEYVDLVLYSKLLPTWGHIPFSVVERALDDVHIIQHNVPPRCGVAAWAWFSVGGKLWGQDNGGYLDAKVGGK